VNGNRMVARHRYYSIAKTSVSAHYDLPVTNGLIVVCIPESACNIQKWDHLITRLLARIAVHFQEILLRRSSASSAITVALRTKQRGTADCDLVLQVKG